jgi:predicted O-methyltransferase YrrM
VTALREATQSARHYLRLLDWIHCYLLPRSYVEIGIFEGKSFALALPSTNAIGVDPDPQLHYAIDPTARVFPETSDRFFERDVRGELLSGQPLDLAFIDGLHQFEYAFRDFINTERIASPGSVILIHDVYPPGAEVAAAVSEARLWAGDVWKVVAALKDRRRDLSVHTVAVEPTGLAVVTRLDPTSTVLSDNYDEIVAEFGRMRYDTFAAAPAQVLNLVDDCWETVMGLLPPPFRTADVRALRRQRALRLPPRVTNVPVEVERRIGQGRLGPPLRSIKASLRSLTKRS